MIEIIVQNVASNIDSDGNVSWGHVLTDTTTRKSIKFLSPHSSNVESALYEKFGGWERFYSIEIRKPIREFNRFFKGAIYSGCSNMEINRTIDILFEKADRENT